MKRKLLVSLLRWHQAAARPLPAWLQHACEHDPMLAAERNAGHGLTEALKNGFRARSIEPSPYLVSRIKRSLQSAESGERTASERTWSLAWTGVAAGVGLLLVVTMGLLRRGLVPEAPRAETAVVASNASDPSPTPPRDDLITSAVVDTTAAVMRGDGPWTNPLRQELANVVADARGAMHFLASNFLPSDLADAAIAPAESTRRPAG